MNDVVDRTWPVFLFFPFHSDTMLIITYRRLSRLKSTPIHEPPQIIHGIGFFLKAIFFIFSNKADTTELNSEIRSY